MMNKQRSIYLDYAASTPIDPWVKEKLCSYLEQGDLFANPSSMVHRQGQAIAAMIDEAREQLASVINAKSNEIIWTSCAAESNNLAIKGIAEFHRRRGQHIIACQSEHESVLKPCAYLEQNGFEVTYLRPQKNGLVDNKQLAQAMRDDTILVSIMAVNNETGVIQDIENIAKLSHQKGAYCHVDAVQAIGKMPLDVRQWGADLVSFSGHKVYAPKGVGCLYVRREPRVRLSPQIHGGGQENGLRSGTLATHQILAMRDAFVIAKERLADDSRHAQTLHDKLWQGLQILDGIHLNGEQAPRVPNIMNISFERVDGNALLAMLPNLAVSSSSACTSGSLEPSHVLRAMGVPSLLAHASLRLSFGRYTTEQDIEDALKMIVNAIQHLRDMSPL